MPRIKDMMGYKVERLTVVELCGRDKHGAALWKCKCDCGNIRLLTRGMLIYGRNKSCGCYRRERMSNMRRKPMGEAARNCLYPFYRHSAKHRNLSFELSRNEFNSIILKNCYYCGSYPSNVSKSGHNNGDFIYSGIDRMNNEIGYTLENCVPCCIICNRAKNNLSFNEFLNWISKLVENNK